MKIPNYDNWKLWTQQLLDWLENQFAAVASSIDFTPVNNKLDVIGGKIGTPAEGQPTTLFGAIAAGGSGGGDDAHNLAQFFGLPEALPSGYEFMTDTEVTDELEDIMQALDPELLQEVEYPEGSGQMITKAQFITIQAMEEVNNIINPSQS